jgi:serine/threonine protein kinase
MIVGLLFSRYPRSLLVLPFRKHSTPTMNVTPSGQPFVSQGATVRVDSSSNCPLTGSPAFETLEPDTDATVYPCVQPKPAHVAKNAGFLEINNQYTLIEVLGEGAQGKVHQALDGEGNVLAIKEKKVGKLRRRYTDGEVEAMSKISHYNVVKLHDALYCTELQTMYLLMQYAEHGSVMALTCEGKSKKTAIEPMLLVNYASQLCVALRYIHEQGVIHRDIKPDNVLLDVGGRILISDFGTAELFGPLEPRLVSGTHSGTRAFMSPELIASSSTALVDGEAVDVWALGVTLYTMLYGTVPWVLERNTTKHELDIQIQNTAINFAHKLSHSSPTAHAQQLLLDHRWPEILKKMLERSPTQRIGVADALKLFNELAVLLRPDADERAILDLILFSGTDVASDVSFAESITGDTDGSAVNHPTEPNEEAYVKQAPPLVSSGVTGFADVTRNGDAPWSAINGPTAAGNDKFDDG